MGEKRVGGGYFSLRVVMETAASPQTENTWILKQIICVRLDMKLCHGNTVPTQSNPAPPTQTSRPAGQH